MMWKSYLYIFCGIFTAVLGGAAFINYTIDVQGVYHGNRESAFHDAYAQRLLSSTSGLIATPKERQIKLRLARWADADCYVAGSSHVMQVDNANMPALTSVCDKTLNLGVSGAAYEDLLIAAAETAQNPHAKRFILGLAPWSLRLGVDPRWSDVKDAYFSARTYFDLPAATETREEKQKLQNLISGAYLRRNLEWLQNNGLNFVAKAAAAEVHDYERASQDNETRFLPTGRFVYSQGYMAGVPAPIGRIGLGTYKIAQPATDPQVIAELGQVVKRLQNQGITVDFLLMPYHPKVFECTKPFICSAFATAETAIHKIADKFKVRVIGGFDPRPMGLEHNDFIDDQHVAPGTVAKIPVPVLGH